MSGGGNGEELRAARGSHLCCNIVRKDSDSGDYAMTWCREMIHLIDMIHQTFGCACVTFSTVDEGDHSLGWGTEAPRRRVLGTGKRFQMADLLTL